MIVPPLTEENVQVSISAAFDSVNLINELKAKLSLTEEEQDRLDSPEIVLAKDWFATALTEQQRTDIDACLI